MSSEEPDGLEGYPATGSGGARRRTFVPWQTAFRLVIAAIVQAYSWAAFARNRGARWLLVENEAQLRIEAFDRLLERNSATVQR